MSEALSMDSYYYSFEATGIYEIDKILSAVATASKAVHHTEGWWTDFTNSFSYPPHKGACPIDWIQNAANEAAVVFSPKDQSERATFEMAARLLKERDTLVEALQNSFCVVFLDGRNEHGSHVLPSFPRSFDADAAHIGEQAEEILSSALGDGFSVGDHVWAEFAWNPPQIDHEGRVELAGYWEFQGINKAMSELIDVSKAGA